MKISKQARRDAKELFRACQVNGLLDEDRVRRAVHEVVARKPRGYNAILSHFERLVRLDIDRRSARVENAVETPPELMAALEASLARRYGPGLKTTFWINPELIGGLRVKVGSDLYDSSVLGRLNALRDSF